MASSLRFVVVSPSPLSQTMFKQVSHVVVASKILSLFILNGSSNPSYILGQFFVTILFGLAHGLVLLPVLLRYRIYIDCIPIHSSLSNIVSLNNISGKYLTYHLTLRLPSCSSPYDQHLGSRTILY